MTLRLETDGPVARLLIDRPEKRNAFTHAMWELLPELLATAIADKTVRIIILQSARAGVFCAGADISELMANKDDASWRKASQTAINRAQYELARADKPTIAFIDGDCVGGGCGLAIACDIRVAKQGARMGITPSKLGLCYPLHDTKLLVDLIGPGQTKKLLFTGALIDAEEALRIGLVESVADSAEDLAQMIVANSGQSTGNVKRFVRRILDGQTEDDVDTLKIFADAFTSADFLEGTSAFLEKRKAQFS